jgi:hypothetical protein
LSSRVFSARNRASSASRSEEISATVTSYPQAITETVASAHALVENLIRAAHAARWYTWSTPPNRSRHRMSRLAIWSGVTSGTGKCRAVSSTAFASGCPGQWLRMALPPGSPGTVRRERGHPVSSARRGALTRGHRQLSQRRSVAACTREWTFVGCCSRPFTGSRSCGQADMITIRFVLARSRTRSPDRLYGGSYRGEASGSQ